MIEEDEARRPHVLGQDEIDGNILNNNVLRHDTALDVLALRLRGCYEDVKEFLSAPSANAHDETRRRLYFTGVVLDKIVNYLDEHEPGEAAT